MQQQAQAIAYVPKILRSLTEICEEMGVSAKVVRRWVAEGAPIAVDGEGNKMRYSAEAGRLQLWRERHCAMLLQQADPAES